MNEEEIIEYIKDEIENETDTYHWFDDMPENKTRKQLEESINAHQGLLDLYQKEKEKNKELEANYDKLSRHFVNNHISKDKIKAKIEEVEKEYFKMLSDGTLSLETKNINAHRKDAMKTVLQEVLEEVENE